MVGRCGGRCPSCLLPPEEGEGFGEGDEDGEGDVDHGEEDADGAEAELIEEVAEEGDDAEEDEPAVDGAGEGVGDEPGARFSSGGMLGFRAEDVFLGVAAYELAALGHEVGDFEEVGEEVVAVVTEEGIGIEEEGGDAAEEIMTLRAIWLRRPSVGV